MDRRLKLLILPAVAITILGCQKKPSPNVLLIITDDQGYGDLSYTGNPHLKTPNIDRLAGESVRFTNFYVCPVSAPTRSSLMTGRYSLRTGVHDTYNGGAIMAANEITIAEILKEKGYHTGIFGKWHLGDNYPCRPGDQGFDESVVHLGGGMGQPGDFTTFFKGDSSYFDPVLWHNGKKQSYTGYCSDIFTDLTLDFISENRNKPFFCYLSFNAPHTPLQVPGEYYSMFRDIDPSSGFESDNRPFAPMNENNKEDARKVYAMVRNIDDNIGKVLQRLDELNLDENTILIFMTDNGPQQTRYNAGMRGLKSSVYRGGVRVPFFIKYPQLKKDGMDINTTSANIDILPTLAELCNASLPSDRKIDGKSLVPLMKGEDVTWKERSLFFYWTRKYPELYNNVALLNGSYKLVGHTDFDSEPADFELYDIERDPYEQNNIIRGNLSKATSLKKELDLHFQDLLSSPNLTDPQRIIIGSPVENPVCLNRNDAEGDRGIWTQEEIFGKWRVTIQEGTYSIRCHFLNPLREGGQMMIETGTIINQKRNLQEGLTILAMNNIKYPQMDCDFIPFYQIGSKRILPLWIEVERVR
ncbi:MAG TPA: arylsulfatase [Bacteroidales bacterium]|nr:arylsulfatase [Bacteroidales bacterium]